MRIEGEQILLRVYLRATDQFHLAPAYVRLVEMGRKKQMAGATVLQGIYGYGRDGVHEEKALSWAHDVPVIVEMVDGAEKVAGFVREDLAEVFAGGGGMATLERAHVMLWRKRDGKGGKLTMGGQIPVLSTVPAIERSEAMQTIGDGLLLRIFIGDSDKAKGEPLYKAIVGKARELGLRGATVLRGSMGFGANSVLHTAKVLELSTDLPIVIEIVDERSRIEKLLPYLEETVQEGMMTMEDVRVLMYRHDPADTQRKR